VGRGGGGVLRAGLERVKSETGLSPFAFVHVYLRQIRRRGRTVTTCSDPQELSRSDIPIIVERKAKLGQELREQQVRLIEDGDSEAAHVARGLCSGGIC